VLAGTVADSSRLSQAIACDASLPHISGLGDKAEQTAGRSGRPNSRQCESSSSCMQRTPAGLPSGMPGMAELIDGAMQQAPQRGRQFMKGLSRWGVVVPGA
jgi:hypothetical protein